MNIFRMGVNCLIGVGSFAILLGAALPAFADARVQRNCHIPYDNTNVNLEAKIDCEVFLLDRNGAIWTSAVVENKNLTTTSVPAELRPDEDDPDGIQNTTTTGDDSGTVCTVVEENWAADGPNYTEYTTDNWTATTTVKRTAALQRFDVTYSLTCIQATQ